MVMRGRQITRRASMVGASMYFVRELVQMIDRRFLMTSATIIGAVQFPFFVATLLGLTDKVEDFAYGISFVAVAIGTLLLKSTLFMRQLAVTGMVSMWGLRLAVYLLYRAFHMRDQRVEPFKKSVSGLTFLWFFQSVAVWIAALPVAMLNSYSHNPTIGVRDIVGYAMFFTGFLIEAVSDWQQFQFKKVNKDRFMHVGLFKYSRHPNYFGDILLHWGIFTCVAPTLRGWTWVCILGPLFHTFMIMFVTGIPPLERMLNEKYQNDPAYQRYRANTPILIPALPKTATSGTVGQEKVRKME